jgi:hypothetical protein
LYGSDDVTVRALLVPLLFLSFASVPASGAEHHVRVTREAVYVDGAVRWRGSAVTSPAVWSQRGDAVAFTGRDQLGRVRLVVVLVDDALEPTFFSWPIPRQAWPARAVTWLGDGRLGAGPSELQPKMVVAFTVGDR